MKNKYHRSLRNFFLISLGLLLLGVLNGCDKPDFFSNLSQEPPDDGAVQTEWQEAEKITIQKPENDNPSITSDIISQSSEKQITIQKGKYTVQVGAFLIKKNATRLIKKLKKKGYQPFLKLSKFRKKEWNIVRMGLYENRKQAIQFGKTFSGKENMEVVILMNDSIIKVEKDMKKAPLPITITPTTVEHQPSKHFKYSFQVGGLRTHANAQQQKKILKKKGYAPFIIKTIGYQESEIWYSLRIGYFDTIEEAADAASQFSGKEDIPAMVKGGRIS